MSKVELRLPSLPDSQQMLDWENNPENWLVSENDSNYSLEDIQNFIRENKHSTTQKRWMIDFKSQTVGMIDLFEISNNSAGVGVLVDSKFQNLGIAKLALSELETVAVTKLNLKVLKATVHQANIPSVRLFESQNFKKIKSEGVKSINGQYIQTIFFEKWLKR